MYKSLLNFKLLGTIFIGSLGLSASLGAQATVVSALQSHSGGEFYVGDTTSQVEFQSDEGTTSVASSVSLSSTTNHSALSNSAFGYSNPNWLVSYGASASGTGTFGSYSGFVNTFDIYNDSNFTQEYTLSYFIYASILKIDGIFPVGSGGANFFVSILDEKTTIFSRSAQLEQLSDGSYRSTIGNMVQGVDYDWSSSTLHTNDMAGTLDLGTLNAGESKRISYIVQMGASGWWDTDQCSFSTPGSGPCAGGSSAFIGDLGGVNGDPRLMAVSSHAVNTLPLPGTLALSGLGLIGLGFSRRQQRPRNK